MSRPRILDLSQGGWTVIDVADWPTVKDLTLYLGTNGYVYYSIWEDGRSVPRTVHGLIMRPPKGAHVDHINGDKTDNRRENLRIVTPQRNQVNRKSLNRNNTSGVRGITVRAGTRNPYIAQIMVAGHVIYLGSFSTLDAATQARRDAELLHFGEICP